MELNTKEWLKFELTYFEATIQHFSHYAKGTSCREREIEEDADREWDKQIDKEQWGKEKKRKGIEIDMHTKEGI